MMYRESGSAIASHSSVPIISVGAVARRYTTQMPTAKVAPRQNHSVLSMTSPTGTSLLRNGEAAQEKGRRR